MSKGKRTAWWNSFTLSPRRPSFNQFAQRMSLSSYSASGKQSCGKTYQIQKASLPFFECKSHDAGSPQLYRLRLTREV